MYGYIPLDWLKIPDLDDNERDEFLELAYDYRVRVWFAEVEYRKYDTLLGLCRTFMTRDIIMFSLTDTYSLIDLMTDYLNQKGLDSDVQDLEEFICDNIVVTKEEFTTDRPRVIYI